MLDWAEVGSVKKNVFSLQRHFSRYFALPLKIRGFLAKTIANIVKLEESFATLVTGKKSVNCYCKALYLRCFLEVI